MSVEIGDRVRLHVKQSPMHPAERFYNGRTGIVIGVTDNPWFPVLVSVTPDEEARLERENAYFRESECEVIVDE